MEFKDLKYGNLDDFKDSFVIYNLDKNINNLCEDLSFTFKTEIKKNNEGFFLDIKINICDGDTYLKRYNYLNENDRRILDKMLFNRDINIIVLNEKIKFKLKITNKILSDSIRKYYKYAKNTKELVKEKEEILIEKKIIHSDDSIFLDIN